MAVVAKILQVRRIIAAALEGIRKVEGRSIDLAVREGRWDANDPAPIQAVVGFASFEHAAESAFQFTTRDVNYHVMLVLKAGDGSSAIIENDALQAIAEVEYAVMHSEAIAAVSEYTSVVSAENLNVLQAGTYAVDVIVRLRISYPLDNQLVEQP